MHITNVGSKCTADAVRESAHQSAVLTVGDQATCDKRTAKFTHALLFTKKDRVTHRIHRDASSGSTRNDIDAGGVRVRARDWSGVVGRRGVEGLPVEAEHRRRRWRFHH